MWEDARNNGKKSILMVFGKWRGQKRAFYMVGDEAVAVLANTRVPQKNVGITLGFELTPKSRGNHP